MRCLIIICLTYLLCSTTNAQESFYDFIKLGDDQVGIMDTIIFDLKYNYETSSYTGKKPYFIKIWHPVGKKHNGRYVKVKELFTFKQDEKLKIIQEQLTTEYKNLFIRDYLTENLKSGNLNNYGTYSHENVLDEIGELETRCIASSLIEVSNFPVVIYYNGSQGHPFENFGLFEYLSSRGFIVISASFELQFENNPFGMLPYERYVTDEYQESLKTITRFAQSITNSPYVFFVGHSLGAQMGLRTFGQDTTIRGMVSLETSIEFTSDYEKIKELWPEVYHKIVTESVNYPFPILFCAATGEAKPFHFLENVKSPQVTYVSTTKEFEHNAYLSLFYLRYFLNNSVRQTDKEIIEKRLPLYAKHLDILHNFMVGIIKSENKAGVESMLVKE